MTPEKELKSMGFHLNTASENDPVDDLLELLVKTPEENVYLLPQDPEEKKIAIWLVEHATNSLSGFIALKLTRYGFFYFHDLDQCFVDFKSQAVYPLMVKRYRNRCLILENIKNSVFEGDLDSIEIGVYLDFSSPNPKYVDIKGRWPGSPRR